tara:strand:- start:1870 stop:2199 length:330 start_codon:yes stop_codon:yes gene_type:complete
MPRNGKSYGRVKIKKIKHDLDDIPEDCGYDKRFKYDIDMNANGIMGDCIEWCTANCKSKWGWWFESPENYNPYQHNWEEQNSFMSFEDKREAMAFFLAIGMANMGNKDR